MAMTSTMNYLPWVSWVWVRSSWECHSQHKCWAPELLTGPMHHLPCPQVVINLVPNPSLPAQAMLGPAKCSGTCSGAGT